MVDGVPGFDDRPAETEILGGSGDDIFTGNSAANIIDGGDGDDDIRGALGGDMLTGGEGNVVGVNYNLK